MDSFTIKSCKYKEWLKCKGVKFLKDCEIADLRLQNEGRGIIAIEDIDEGETIFEIPRSIMLNIESCSLIEQHPEVVNELKLLNQWEALIIVLLYELKVKELTSKWSPYFDILPISDSESYKFNQLMFWSDEELELLKPSLIIQRIGRELAKGMYNKLFPNIVLNKMKLEELKDVTLDEYHKIASLIMSYSFDIEKLNKYGVVEGNGEHDEDEEQEQEEPEEGDDETSDSEFKEEIMENDNKEAESPISSDEEYPDSILNDTFLKAMIPLADTLNADTNLHNASLEYHGDKLIIKAIKPIKKGGQIYNTYSDHPNSEILRRYGYVELEGSKHDFGEIPLRLIQEYFSTIKNPLEPEFFQELMTFFNRIIEEETDDEVTEFVLDSYDCFRSSEIIIELIILLQCLAIIASINAVHSMKSLSKDSKYQLVRRIYRKCIQLIESKKLTTNFLLLFKNIINLRLSQYPISASKPIENYDFSRKSMANVVLRSEYMSLKSCLDIDKTFTVDDTKYSFIDDDKLIRNIIKRKFDLPIPPNKKVKHN